MGSVSKAIERPFKRLNRDLVEKPFARGKEITRDFGRQLEKPIRTGASGQARNANRLSLLQTQREKARAVEAEDEIALRRGLASSKTAGRQSLIRSGGSSKTLGGT